MLLAQRHNLLWLLLYSVYRPQSRRKEGGLPFLAISSVIICRALGVHEKAWVPAPSPSRKFWSAELIPAPLLRRDAFYCTVCQLLAGLSTAFSSSQALGSTQSYALLQVVQAQAALPEVRTNARVRQKRSVKGLQGAHHVALPEERHPTLRRLGCFSAVAECC